MRKMVSALDLLARVNASLAEHEEGEGCEFQGPIRRLSVPADDGRNWSDVLTLCCGGQPASDCSEAAMQVLRRAAAIFNVD